MTQRYAAPRFRMTLQGVGETEALADALGFWECRAPGAVSKHGGQPPALRRLLQALQYFGQVIPFSILPAAFAAFHSAPHFF